jgi:hypothetical protein
MALKLYTALLIVILFGACKNIEDAKPTDRTSFVRFYGSGINHEGVMALPDTDGGYILVGNVKEGDFTNITIIKTDDRGNTIWKTVVPDGSANSVIIADDGYFVTGDRIIISDRPGVPLSEVFTTQGHVFKVDRSGNYLTNEEIIIKDTVDRPIDEPVIDYKGHASVIKNDSLYVLGSSKEPQLSLNEETYEQALIYAYSLNSLGSDVRPAWNQAYTALFRNFKNTNMLHLPETDYFIWANSVVLEEDGNSRKDAQIYVAGKNSSNTDKDLLEVSNRSFEASDMQPSSSFGYGVVGTYSQTDGSGSNIFFARYQQEGADKGELKQIKYFDGVTLTLEEANRDQSTSTDEGKAITGTSDGGFVMACTFTTTLQKGNGEKDILLIKVDAFGEFVWSELIGGSGDEIPASIRESENGSLLIAGTNNVSGLSSLLLIKTNSRGKLTN